jgi:flagellar biosynthesis protein FlhG
MNIDNLHKVPYITTISSGKGGVGKSIICSNLAYISAQNGMKTLLWDFDLHFPNLHLILGAEPPIRLNDVFAGRVKINKAISKLQDDLYLLAGLPGTGHSIDYDNNRFLELYAELITRTDFDLIIFDTPAGISDSFLQCCNLSDLVQIVVTDEPTSLMDAYGLIKILMQYMDTEKMRLLINNVIDGEDADDISTKLNLATAKFLKLRIDVLGYIPYDRDVRQSIINQELLAASAPDSEVVSSITQVFNKIFANINMIETS